MNKYKNPELIAAVIKAVSNRKNYDKSRLGYIIGMMDAHNCYHTYAAESLRADVLAEFTRLANYPERLARLDNGTCLKEVFAAFPEVSGDFHTVVEFESPISMERSSGLTPVSNCVRSVIEVAIQKDGRGSFEWEVPSLELYESGSLTFDGAELVDYDGVISLPLQLCDALEKRGYDMEYAR